MPKAIKVFSKNSLVAERYRVLGRLGQGGMGVVYKALDCKLNNHVVIKVPLLHLLQEKLFADRFQRELRSLISLSHPNIVRVLDLGEIEGVPYAVFPFLSGKDLNATRPKNSEGNYLPVNIQSVLAWLPQVANALDYVHRNGIIHRDIKPANILFDSERNPFVSDFGIAKILSDSSAAQAHLARTQTGVVLGTPDYTAPELILGNQPTPQADIFSLAMTVYELATGRVPYSDLTPAAVLVKQATDQVPSPKVFNPQLTSQVSQAILQGLAKSPGDRPKTCSEFCESLTAALIGHSATSSSARYEAMPVARDQKTHSNEQSTSIQLQPKFTKSIKHHTKKRNLRKKQKLAASSLLASLLSWVFVCGMVIAITYLTIFKLKLFGEPPQTLGPSLTSQQASVQQKTLESRGTPNLAKSKNITTKSSTESATGKTPSSPESKTPEKELEASPPSSTSPKQSASLDENAAAGETNRPFEKVLPEMIVPPDTDQAAGTKPTIPSNQSDPIYAATALAKQGKIDEYIRVLRELAKTQQHQSRAFFILAIGHSLTRQSKGIDDDDTKAANYFKKSIEALDAEAKQGNAYALNNISSSKNNLAVVEARRGKIDSALRYWRESLESAGPNQPKILNNIIHLRYFLVAAERTNGKIFFKDPTPRELKLLDELLQSQQIGVQQVQAHNQLGWQFTPFTLQDGTADQVFTSVGLQLIDANCLNCRGAGVIDCTQCTQGKRQETQYEKVEMTTPAGRIEQNVPRTVLVACPNCSGNAVVDCAGCDDGKEKLPR